MLRMCQLCPGLLFRARLRQILMFRTIASVELFQGSSSTYHRIQVGGPANQITTGEIRIDLPSESFQNLKFNITPYSLQNEYSPYYDQYTPGYKPSAYTPPKQQAYKPQPPKPQISYKPAPVVPYKPAPAVSYKPAPVVSYKPAPLVSYKVSPSIAHPVYSFTQPKLASIQPSYHQPKIIYNRPAYTQPNVIFNQPAYTQTKPSATTPKVSEKKSPTPATKITSPSTTSSPVVYINSPPQAAAEGYYGAYPYPYRQSSYTNIKSVVDLKKTEEVTEAAPVEEVTEVAQSEDEVSEKAKTDYETIFRKFVSYGSEPVKSVKKNDNTADPSSADKEADEDEPREAKTIDTDAESSNINTIDSVGSATLLPEFIPIVAEEGGVSPVTEVTPVTRLEITTPAQSTQTTTITTKVKTTSSTVRRKPVTSFLHDSVTTRGSTATSGSSSIRRRPVTSVFHDSLTTTIRQTTTVSTGTPTTTREPVKTTTPIATTDARTTAKSTETVSLGTTSSHIRRRPVVSVFHDVTSSTPPPAIQHVTPPGQIGQNILDKMRAATLTVETILESEEEITLTPEKSDDEESIKEEENDEGEEEQSRERRKVLKIRKPKSSSTFRWPSTNGF